MRTKSYLVGVVFLLGMVLRSATAQVATGIYTYGTFDNKGFDTINVGNLNINFGIPIFSKPGRGGMNFQFGLTYDSSIYSTVTTGTTTAWQPSLLWGWTNSDIAIAGQLDLASTTGYCTSTNAPSTYQTGFIYYDTNGRPHSFSGFFDDCPDYPAPVPFTVAATDGSGYVLAVNGINNFLLTDANGKTITPTIAAGTTSASISDGSGNQITVNASGSVTDTTGTTVLTVSGSGNASSPTVYTYPVWLNPYSSTTSASATVHYGSYNIATAFGCSGVSEYSQTGASLIDYIQLADGERYSFTYEPTPGSPATITGRLPSTTLPTGGTIAYVYSGGSNGIVCADGGAAGFQRSSSGSTWTYTRTPGATLNASHTDVSDGMSPANHAYYDFISDPTDDPTNAYYLVHGVHHDSTNTVLLDSATCYRYVTGYTGRFGIPHYACSTTTLGWPIYPMPFNNTYDGAITSAAQTYFDQYGRYTGYSTWDFGTPGSGLPGASLTSYASILPPLPVPERPLRRAGMGLAQPQPVQPGSTTEVCSSTQPPAFRNMPVLLRYPERSLTRSGPTWMAPYPSVPSPP